jgi:hypothetical protein
VASSTAAPSCDRRPRYHRPRRKSGRWPCRRCRQGRRRWHHHHHLRWPYLRVHQGLRLGAAALPHGSAQGAEIRAAASAVVCTAVSGATAGAVAGATAGAVPEAGRTAAARNPGGALLAHPAAAARASCATRILRGASALSVRNAAIIDQSYGHLPSRRCQVFVEFCSG